MFGLFLVLTFKVPTSMIEFALKKFLFVHFVYVAHLFVNECKHPIRDLFIVNSKTYLFNLQKLLSRKIDFLVF